MCLLNKILKIRHQNTSYNYVLMFSKLLSRKIFWKICEIAIFTSKTPIYRFHRKKTSIYRFQKSIHRFSGEYRYFGNHCPKAWLKVRTFLKKGNAPQPYFKKSCFDNGVENWSILTKNQIWKKLHLAHQFFKICQIFCELVIRSRCLPTYEQ